MKKLLPIFIIVILAAVGASFYGGMKYSESKNPFQNFQGLSSEQRQQFVNRSGEKKFAGDFRPTAGTAFLNGEIINKDENSLTLKLGDGGSRIVFFSNATDIREFVKSSPADVKIGDQISVSGEKNSDGSYTAEVIQISRE